MTMASETQMQKTETRAAPSATPKKTNWARMFGLREMGVYYALILLIFVLLIVVYVWVVERMDAALFAADRPAADGRDGERGGGVGVHLHGGRGHAADRAIGARIHREKQSGVADFVVELLARDARLHRAVEIIDVHRNDIVHAAHVHANAAVEGEHVAFE